MTRQPIIIFSDLDGTLLDHDTYDWSPAQPALELLRRQSIPLVLASSKTAAEMAPLRTEIGFSHCPAIVENGAGVLAANVDATETDDRDWKKLRQALDTLPPVLRAKFSGFGDMGIDGIAQATGLAPDKAARAAQRCFSEPGLWYGSAFELEDFVRQLNKQGITARSGGRFLTLSLGRSKADQMEQIALELFGQNTPKHTITSVALGDAPNDAEMLLAATQGWIVKNPHAIPIAFPQGCDISHIKNTRTVGPTGWNEAVLSVLSESHGYESE